MHYWNPITKEYYEGPRQERWHQVVTQRPSTAHIWTGNGWALSYEAELQQVRDKRASEYPSLADQLDALWKGGTAQEEMQARVMAVKNNNPKPEPYEEPTPASPFFPPPPSEASQEPYIEHEPQPESMPESPEPATEPDEPPTDPDLIEEQPSEPDTPEEPQQDPPS